MVESNEVLVNIPDISSAGCLKSICRTCLAPAAHSSIEETKLDGVHLNEIIHGPLLQLEANDEFPDKMCKPCIEMTYNIYHFVNRCKGSEETLKEALKNIKSEPINGTLINADSTNVDIQIPLIQFEDVRDHLGDKSEMKSMQQLDSNIYEPLDLEIRLSECDSKNSDFEVKDTQLGRNKRKQVRLKNKLRIRKLTKAELQQQVASMLKGRKKRIYILRKTADQVSKDSSYQCITCESSFDSYEELKEHKLVMKHTKSLKYKCEYCDKKLDTYSKLEEHARTHTGEKPNKCMKCGKCFNFKTDLKRHMTLHMDVKPYICRYCSKGFTRKQYLVDHERKHTGEKLLCPFCGRGFYSYSTLMYHEKVHKGPDGTTKQVINDKLFKCHLCDKTLLTEHTLKAHVMLHGPKNFSCEICGKTYINNNRLQDHIKLTHQGLKFKCPLCDKEYKHKTGLDVHMRMHSGENNYPCDECGKQFACKGSLYQHKRLHTGDTKYQCKQCLHISINKRNMETHMRTHTGEKPFACPYCGKLFSQKVNMRAHTKIHTGEKNHLCKFCDKAFYTGRALRKHATVHEKGDECDDAVNR